MRIYRKKVAADLRAEALHDAAYALLREALRADWNCPDAVIEKTALGKPYLRNREDLHISVSHTRGLVCCAVADHPVGVDCEYRRSVPERVLKRVCTPRELESISRTDDPETRALSLWTLKESISKKLGMGLKRSFRQYEIEWEETGPRCAGHGLHLETWEDFFIAAAE